MSDELSVERESESLDGRKMGDSKMDLIENRDLLPKEVTSSFMQSESSVEELGVFWLNSPKSEVNDEYLWPVDPFGVGMMSGFAPMSSLLEKLGIAMLKSSPLNMDETEVNEHGLPVDPTGAGTMSLFTPTSSLLEKLNAAHLESEEYLLPTDPFGMEIMSSFTPITVSLENWDANPLKSGKLNINEDEVNQNLLPVDPFGMEIMSSYTRITSLPENLDAIQFNPSKLCLDGPSLFADLSFMWKAYEGIFKDTISFDSGMSSISSNLFDGGSVDQANDMQNCEKLCPGSLEGEPHEALFLSLGYLGVSDLLSIERVCRSLCEAVKTDTVLWRKIHIYEPLSYRLNDDALLHLTNRAQGTLQCLNLVKCMNITDDGLQRVLQLNPGLEKLSVPECVRLTIERIMDNLNEFKSTGTLKLKYLRVGGIRHFGLTDKLYEGLKFLLGADDDKRSRLYKPQNYGGKQLSVSCNDDRAIDIEPCPRCQNFNLVYDCPREGCQGKYLTDQSCRACALCIRRCFQCGCCIENCEYEETFLKYFLCIDCFLSSEVRVAYHESYVLFCG